MDLMLNVHWVVYRLSRPVCFFILGRRLLSSCTVGSVQDQSPVKIIILPVAESADIAVYVCVCT